MKRLAKEGEHCRGANIGKIERGPGTDGCSVCKGRHGVGGVRWAYIKKMRRKLDLQTSATTSLKPRKVYALKLQSVVTVWYTCTHTISSEMCFQSFWSKDWLSAKIGKGDVRTVCAVQVFRVASVCLGSPPETICWEYRDKDKNFHRMGPLTPQEFYREHVKPLYNIQDKVCSPLNTSDGPCNVCCCFSSVQTLIFCLHVGSSIVSELVWWLSIPRSASWTTLDPRTLTVSCTVLSSSVTWLGAAAHCTTTNPSSCLKRLRQSPSRRER